MVIPMVDAIAPHLCENLGTEFSLGFTPAPEPSFVVSVGRKPLQKYRDAAGATVHAIGGPGLKSSANHDLI
ncbi:hypothetical protein PGT21_014160 [Puccinia graminis f. sp. tritici]|uniref:Uncharacterized protein n=1 Tax=Puccinia graminis f. sp. tritici TaxID=56615 RepID=A0A5B0PEU2_PUCGR|nr:hypothetical protein PGT21_010113 [Puccinia graminis f. sp. tritici]KAA1103782.1 hypothetical protein PGTUg99_007130 [Puccinia graminis f. sp. tritici]KAA1117547.1 hypothetical protein PGT21_014160 [Puccinia graminis f. sp. tritici]